MSDAITPRGTVLAGSTLAGAAVRFHWIALILCAATMFTEGYDAQFMGSVVPGIAADYGLAPGALWPALSSGLVGLMLVAIFGILTIASSWADALAPMTVLRFFTGLGLGGAMANTTALTAEFSPPE